MKKTIAITISILALLALALMHVSIPYTIRSKGIAKPAQTWGLYKSFDGTLVNMYENHLTGSINEYKVFEFQRGDIVAFHFNDALTEGEGITIGDTVAWVTSNNMRLAILEKEGAIAQEQAKLKVYATGDKPEALALAREQVDLARQKLDVQQSVTDRMVRLYQQQLIPQQEYELSVNDLKIREHQLEIARSAYAAILAGEKEEEINAIRSRIAALEQQKDHLREHMVEMNILSPVSGQLLRQSNPDRSNADEIIKVADLSSYVVFVPIDLFEKQFIGKHQPVTLRMSHSRKTLPGIIIGIDNTIQMINRQPRVFASVLINNDNGDTGLLPEMVLDATIQCQPVSLAEFLIRKSRIVYQN